MAGSDDSGDKTEKPTPKKLQDARKKGDVSKSKDITATAGMLAILLLAAVALPVVAEQMAALVRASFEVMQEPFELAMPRLGRQAALTLLSVVGMVVLPVALVVAGCSPQQQEHETRLAMLAEAAVTLAGQSPVLMIMGEVVSLRSELNALLTQALDRVA